ncbi:hypothetical protein ECDEC7E_1601 [Escherichia coli DEC7E]|nr:hypothetical protein ECDEC7E_1601 [Escherichia coli DEC7E]
MPENPASYRVVRKKSYLFNKAIHRVKQVVTASLKLRDYDGQVAEAMPMIQK